VALGAESGISTVPNLLITTVCNRDCPYCFARGKIRSENATRFISLEDVDRVVGFLEKSGVNTISLLGGEPTLHPSFCEIFDRIRNHGFSVDLFTNGLMGDKAIACLAAADPDRLIVTVNVNHPESTPRHELQQVRGVLEKLGKKAMVGFNIAAPDVDMGFLVELIRTTGITRCVRLGLAHPIAGGNGNAAMSPRGSLAVGSRIVEFARECDEQNISIAFDCGFLFCMFSDEEMGRLVRYRSNMEFSCRPAIDIGPDLDVWRCFPLYRRYRKKLTDFNSFKDVEKHFDSKLLWLSAHGCLPGCRGCRYLLRGQCSGGCMSHKMRALLPFPRRIDRDLANTHEPGGIS
jgi:hypothetical protein